MKIIIDAMGGDNAPEEIVRGAALASREFDAELALVGDTERINSILAETDADMSKITVIHSDSVVTMEDEPTAPVRGKKDSSLSIGLKLLREDGDAFVSAGNTGAIHVGSSLLVRTVKGVERAAIGTIIPFKKPILLMDSGANVNVLPEYYVNWAVMGQIYMKNVMGVENPTVGMLNNGAEEHKGTETEIAAYKLLTEDDRVNFVGNIEAKEVMNCPCDVIVTDGFTGNVMLKTIEGMSKFIFKQLKGVFLKNILTKLSYLIVKKPLYEMKDSFDASVHGGSPLIGLNKPVIKAHGSADAIAIKNAVRQAVAFAGTGVPEKIKEALAVHNAERES